MARRLAACQRVRARGGGKHAFCGAAREGGGEGDFARACVGVPLNFRRVKSGFTVIIARIPTAVL